ncbi:hypothetical protein KBC31_04715 [Candidatus Saccharibacteria bacterium]|nr:hypothetical protein [Candidatus Saccharibacteria bacterium]
MSKKLKQLTKSSSFLAIVSAVTIALVLVFIGTLTYNGEEQLVLDSGTKPNSDEAVKQIDNPNEDVLPKVTEPVTSSSIQQDLKIITSQLDEVAQPSSDYDANQLSNDSLGINQLKKDKAERATKQ